MVLPILSIIILHPFVIPNLLRFKVLWTVFFPFLSLLPILLPISLPALKVTILLLLLPLIRDFALTVFFPNHLLNLLNPLLYPPPWILLPPLFPFLFYRCQPLLHPLLPSPLPTMILPGPPSMLILNPLVLLSLRKFLNLPKSSF